MWEWNSGEMQIKTKISYHLTSVKRVIIKILQIINAGEDVEKGILLYCRRECKLVQPLWRTVWWWCGLVTKLCWNVAIPCRIVHQDPLSMEFSRQEYQSGLPFPSPGDFPNPGIEPISPSLQVVSCIAGGFSTIDASGNGGSLKTYK